MVRFKHPPVLNLAGNSTMFQFHDGSIQAVKNSKSTSTFSAVSIPRWFDSSHSSHFPVKPLVLCFNSTMVRFKRITDAQGLDAELCFNSTMVRFKHAPGCLLEGFRLSFQFHDGSIQADRSKGASQAQASFQFHDGSIQALRQARISRTPIAFQFHDGSIQARA